jgi:hypothetical protein
MHLWLTLLTAYGLSLADRKRSLLVWSQSSQVGSSVGDLERRATAMSNNANSDTEGSSVVVSDSESGYESEGSMSAMRRRQRNPADKGFQDLMTEFKTRYLLALLYLGGRSLRMPLLTADIIRWANNGDIPYYFTEKYLGDSLSQGYNMNRLGMDRKVPYFLLLNHIKFSFNFNKRECRKTTLSALLTD